MLSHLGVVTPDILLPRDGEAYDAWAVVACDQFTQDRAYWDEVAAFTAGRPSALDIVLPEIDLDKADERVPRIHDAMLTYRKDILTRRFHGAALVKRTRGSMRRHGLMLAVDLECYDYAPGSRALIRATEGTIEERLPPRMKIRQGACLETPHILLLIDDPERTVIEPLFADFYAFDTLYDFSLMMGGGRIEGRAVTDEGRLAAVTQSLGRLASDEWQSRRYGDAYDGSALLFAAGDGNHSLATAKACWERRKPSLSPAEKENHPARFALVEIVNLHDPGLLFEPIHRVLFGVEPEAALADLAGYLKARGGDGGGQTLFAVSLQGEARVHTARAPHTLPVGSLQGWMDDYLFRNKHVCCDYIHGDDEAKALGAQEGALAFLLPSMDKNSLFTAVMRDGALPRKTFSMGGARDKRYYLECRSIEP